jgi:hypothetical protein
MNTVLDSLLTLNINWEATEAGFEPVFTGGDPVTVTGLGEDAIPTLIAALDDETLFVRAHVLLTHLSGVEYAEFPTWNGLVIEMAPNGDVTIDSAQRPGLAARWRRWYELDPRPTALPRAGTP